VQSIKLKVPKNKQRQNKKGKSIFLPFVHQGPLYWAELKKKKMKERLPKDYYYNETIGKIKASR
jgi:hypothetical protein